MAVAHMTCYQHFISKISMVPGALRNNAVKSKRLPMIVRAIDGRFLVIRSFCFQKRTAMATAVASIQTHTIRVFYYICVGPRRSLAVCVEARPQAPSSDPFTHPTHPVCGPPAPIRMPPIRSAGLQLRSACHPSSPAPSLLPGENPKAYCLGENICTQMI